MNLNAQLVIPIAKPKFTKTAVDDPLLKVPPARRGNRIGAPLAVPLAKRGEPKGGGQIVNFGRAVGITHPPDCVGVSVGGYAHTTAACQSAAPIRPTPAIACSQLFCA